MKKLAFVLAIALVLISCENGTNNSNKDTDNAPTLTDIKIVADVSQVLTGPYLTTLNTGTQYTILFFASDQDLDISKMVIDYYKDNTFVINQESPVFGQTVVSDVFMAYYTPTEPGTWKGEVYVEDAKGNKSNKKSITVTVVTPENNNILSPPSNVTATALSSSSISISWSSVTGATSYDVYYAIDSSTTKNFAVNVTGTSYTHTGLSSSTTYYYYIRAKNNTSSSDYSSYGYATTLSESIAGSSSSNAITISGSTSGSFPSGLDAVWYKFTKNGEGIFSASDREYSSVVYTSNIVVDIYNESLILASGPIYSGSTFIKNDTWYNIDVGAGVSSGYYLYATNWSGTYYIKVRPYNNNNSNKGTFALIAP